MTAYAIPTREERERATREAFARLFARLSVWEKHRADMRRQLDAAAAECALVLAARGRSNA
jgi:hypothetical protein